MGRGIATIFNSAENKYVQLPKAVVKYKSGFFMSGRVRII